MSFHVVAQVLKFLQEVLERHWRSLPRDFQL